MFLRKGVLKKCRKFTGEHPCRNGISIKLQSNFIEIAFRHGCSPVHLLLIFKTPFPKNTSGGLLLIIQHWTKYFHWQKSVGQIWLSELIQRESYGELHSTRIWPKKYCFFKSWHKYLDKNVELEFQSWSQYSETLQCFRTIVIRQK